jgi:predicted nucleotidyltransferase
MTKNLSPTTTADFPLVHILPDDITQDLAVIEQILLGYGAKKIILYGSLARNDYHSHSDIDICVDGLPTGNYFRALAECLMQTTRPTSILDFKDTYGYLRERILAEGKLIAVRQSSDDEDIVQRVVNVADE